MTDYPLLVFVVSLVAFGVSTWLGTNGFRSLKAGITDSREDFVVIQSATLTLLGLLIGFTFSMALSRYDLRKHYEEEEANAIGTEYARADLLPAADGASVRALLRSYLEQRERFFTERDDARIEATSNATGKLQQQLWDAVRTPAAAQPSPLAALAVAGMNDVLNTQGYTQAAWWNRIPVGAWLLMTAIAVVSTLLVGIGIKEPRGARGLLSIMPVVISVAFFLIADIDSPVHGVIRVTPQNLHALSQSLR